MKQSTISGYFAIFAIFCALCAAVMPGQEERKCAEFNEYCLNHWDCCSNSCMSYMYRCTRNYAIYPFPMLGTRFGETEPEPSTLDDILQTMFGNKVVTSTENRLQTQATGEPITTTNAAEGNLTTITRAPTPAEGSSPPAQCKEIGVKCFRNDECCTQRCHGFLHQCVT